MAEGSLRKKAWRIAPLPENLLREPVDFLLADHARIRAAGACLEELVGGACGETTAAVAAWLRDFLTRDLRDHFADEEQDLLPRLQSGWPANRMAEFDRDSHALQQQHRYIANLAAALLPILPGAAGPDAAAERNLSERGAALADMLRRVMAWEEETLLAPARRQMSAADREALGRAMAARRGIRYPEPTDGI
jgi:hypothetical protein